MTWNEVAAAPHTARATPIGTGRINAREWFGALDLPWGTDVVAASSAVERHIDVMRENWTRPSVGAPDVRPLRGSTPVLVETRAPATVWVSGMGLVPWTTTTDVVAWATLIEWSAVRGSWRVPDDQRARTTDWERAHQSAQWEMSAHVVAYSRSGTVRDAGAFLGCVGADGALVRVGDAVVVPRGSLPMPYDGVGLLSAALAVVSAVNRGEATLRRCGRAGIARRFTVTPRGTVPCHPEEKASGSA
jgi:hypothetical protein